MPVVFDHFAGAQAALGSGQPGFDTVLGLVKTGKAYVKVSGAYRAWNNAPDYARRAAPTRACAANPDRLVWGSDWPHPDAVKVEGRKATDIAWRSNR
jgi:predicted TIM-barrel fold metal-dependent hydrolase